MRPLAYHGGVGDPGHAAGPVGSGDPVDPDAMWRRNAGPTAPDPDRRPDVQHTPGAATADPVNAIGAPAAGRAPPASEHVSPWSRQAVEGHAADAIRCRSRDGPPPDAARAAAGLRRRTATMPSAGVCRRAPDDHPSDGQSDAREPTVVSTTRSELILGAVLSAIVLVAATTAIWWMWPASDDRATAPGLPADAERQWTLGPTPEGNAPTAWGRTAVARVVAAEVLVYDLADGGLRWRAPIAGSDPTIAFLDEAVVAVTTTGGADVMVVGFDPADGSTLWRRLEDHAIAVPGPGAPVVFDGRRDAVVMRVLDPLTGDDVGEPTKAVRMSTATPYVVSLVGELLAVLDLRNGTRVGPGVPADGLRSVAPVGGAIVGLTDDDELVLFDEEGEVVDRRAFSSLTSSDSDDSVGAVELVGEVPGTTLGILTAGTSVGFDVGDGRIEPVWEVDGRVRPPVETEIGPVAVVRIVSATSGNVDHALVDARDGSTIAVTDTGIARDGTPVVGADGYVVATAIGDGGRTVSAFGFDGDERWHVALPPAASFEVAPGTLLVLEPSGSISAFS